MFSQKQRMNSKTVAQTLKTGKRFFTSFFRGTFVVQDDFMVSVIIPKKIIKKRIHRNREKRRILHSLKIVLNGTSPKCALILSLQKNTHALSFEELNKELELVCKKIG